jgi:EAL domain-containing protein (putative c-di-GMP-specific phosphodiesterase class I)
VGLGAEANELTVRMAGDLGIQTVAESVQLDVELQAVRLLGVDFAQGFLLGRPSSLSGYDFEALASN